MKPTTGRQRGRTPARPDSTAREDREFVRRIRQRLKRDPAAWGIIARHAIPLIGIVWFGWSALEVVVVLFLDSLSTLCRAAAVATYFTTREHVHADQGVIDRLNLLVGGVVIFAIVASLFAFMLAVFAFFIWGYVLAPAGVDVLTVVSDRGLWIGFAIMLLCQLPGLVDFVRSHDDARARAILEPEVGFVMRRMVIIVMLCGVLRVLPGQVGFAAAIVVIQLVLALAEIGRPPPP